MEPSSVITFEESVSMPPRASKAWAWLAGLWLVVVVAGTLWMVKYAQTPGVAASPPPSVWPQSSAVPRTSGQPVLLMFVHPHCPCSRASIGELDRLVAKCPGKFSTQVMFLRPPGVKDGWERTDLWAQAAAIPGVSVHCDADGTEARRFHAETSGATVLYDGGGHLLFQGGITPSRGHAGDNAGSAAIAAALDQPGAGPAGTAVFGCALCESECTHENVVCKQ